MIQPSFDVAIAALSAGRPSFFSVIQNFRAGGGYVVTAIDADREKAVSTMINSGQRHPGWGVRCVAVREGGAARNEVEVVESFGLMRDTPLILVNMPAPATPTRVEVAWVGRDESSLEAGRKVLLQMSCLAFLVQVEAIGDNEYGEWAGYRQKHRNGIGVGVASVFEL